MSKVMETYLIQLCPNLVRDCDDAAEDGYFMEAVRAGLVPLPPRMDTQRALLPEAQWAVGEELLSVAKKENIRLSHELNDSLASKQGLAQMWDQSARKLTKAKRILKWMTVWATGATFAVVLLVWIAILR